MRERETYFGLSHRNDQVWKKENKFVGCKNGWEQDRSTKQAEEPEIPYIMLKKCKRIVSKYQNK